MEVYFALNKTNGKAYVGWTKDTAAKRFRKHCATTRAGSSYYFHRAIRKYGADAFNVFTVFKGEDVKQMKQVEKNYIAGMNTNDPQHGYNLTEGGEGTLGYRHSEETKRLLSSRKIGNTNAFGHHPSAESRVLMSQHNGRRGNPNSQGNPNISQCATHESCRKGGLAAVASGASRRGGLTAKADGGTNRSLAIARHTRWHLNKGINNPACGLCGREEAA